MKKPTLREMFTIPNILSYFRILLIPLFVYLYFKAETPPSFSGGCGTGDIRLHRLVRW